MTSRPRRRILALAAASLAATALSGCGGLHPGLAYEVGGSSTTTGEVDRLTEDVCTALVASAPEGQVGAAFGDLRAQVVQALLLDEVAADLLAESGATAEVEALVEQQLTGATEGLDDLDPEVRDGYVEAVRALVRSQVAAEFLVAGSMPEDTTDQLPPQQLVALGTQLLWTEASQQGAEINPRYGIELTDDGAVPADGSASIAVSDVARPPADQQAAIALPPGQRCG